MRASGGLTVLSALAVSFAIVLAACADDDRESGDTPALSGTGAEHLVFSPEGNNLDVYSPEPPFSDRRLVTNHDGDPAGWDINGQVCFLPDGRFVAGEDTGQPDPPAGWGVFELDGEEIGDLEARRVARLVPTFQPTDTSPDTYGCGVLDDGRMVTTTIGNSASGPDDGELILWFPPFDSETDVEFCVLDTGIGTAQQIAVDSEDRVYVASARGATAGVQRYSGPLPTAPDAAGGCGRTDASGSPLVDQVKREAYVVPGQGNDLAVVNGIAFSPFGTLFASSIITGTIVELDADGRQVRTVLEPPAGEQLGAEPFSTGTPLGLAVGPDGTLFYADLGLVIDDDGIGPGSSTGSVRRITFTPEPASDPEPPETMASGLTFPDGLGIFGPE